MTYIQTQGLKVSYGERTIIRDGQVSIEKNKITTIIGPNGCGKSTMLKAMARMMPYGGQVLIDGKDVQSHSRKALARILSMLPQKPDAAAGLRVEELVAYGRHPYTGRFGAYGREDLDKIHWAMRVTGLEALAQRPIDTLSGGQRQRVWIALCLAQDTEVIFLDEPTTYLDIAHQIEVLEILLKLKEDHGKTIVMVLHDMNQASRYGDRIIALKSGEVIKVGESHEVITKEVLKELFGVKAAIMVDEKTNKPMCLSYDLWA